MPRTKTLVTEVEPEEIKEEKFDRTFLESYEASRIMFPFELENINRFELTYEGQVENVYWEWELSLLSGRNFIVKALVRESLDPNDTVVYVEEV